MIILPTGFKVLNEEFLVASNEYQVASGKCGV